MISGRVHESLHRQIKQAAKQSGRSMSEELAALAAESLQRPRLIEEVMVLLYGPDVGKLLASGLVNAPGLVQFAPGDKERARAKALALVCAKVNEIFDSIPEKPGVQS